MLVGREPSDRACETNILKHYEELVAAGKTDRWTRIRDEEKRVQGVEPSYWSCPQTVWSRYQTLVDYIFGEPHADRRAVFDFEERVFCSEMNGSPSLKTACADRSGIPDRKRFFRDPFFDRFPVIVLACGDYISNVSPIPEEREIDSIFKVSFCREYGSGSGRFWTHFNADRTRLVIHTRNLCSGVSNTMLREMAKVIRNFLNTAAE